MKTLKLIVVLSLLVPSLAAISQDFGQLGTEWHYNENGGGSANGQEYIHLQSVADTLIDGRNTHKITWTYYRITGQIFTEAPYYVYEEADTVYRWSFDDARFLRLFIFNGNVGDTLVLHKPQDIFSIPDSTYRLVIEAIDSVVVDGILLNRYKVTSLDNYVFYGGGYFMDRIGGLDWFAPRGGIFPEAGGPIRCYSDADLDTSFSTTACNYLSISDISENNSVRIIPNPTTQFVSIESESGISLVEVFGINGRQILATKAKTVNLSELENGVYFVRILLVDGTRLTKKIVKNAPFAH